MKSINVVINTYNEEKNIKECIQSAKLLTDKIYIVDMESTDTTRKIAIAQGAKVLSFPFSQYVEPARKFGIESSECDWVLILDADERITKDSALEIKSSIEQEAYTYYKIPRKNIFGNKKWLQYGGWYPDYQIRLIKKTALIDWPARIHSTPNISGTFEYLKHPIIHYFHPDLSQMVEKTIIFENIESDLLFQAKKNASTSTFFRKFLGELNRRLVKQQGYRDGAYGIIESMYQAFSKTITYLFLYEKNNRI